MSDSVREFSKGVVGGRAGVKQQQDWMSKFKVLKLLATQRFRPIPTRDDEMPIPTRIGALSAWRLGNQAVR
jgi:hypothetical protein